MTIKIAAYPKCFEYEMGLRHTMSVFDWIRLARMNLDVAGLEMYERFLTSFDRGYIQQIADMAGEAGFCIPMFMCSPDFTHPDPDERKRAIDHQVEMIRVAAQLGGPGVVCRVLSGQQHPGLVRQQGIEWVIEAIQQTLPVARQYGVILGMENHYKDSQWTFPEFAFQLDVYLEIIGAIADRQNFGVQYDPSNALLAGGDPILFLESIKHRVVSMHASDRRLKEGITLGDLRSAESTLGYPSYLVHGVIGEGLNDYDAIFRILADIGYQGWISLEDGLKGLSEMQQSVQFLRHLEAKHMSGERKPG